MSLLGAHDIPFLRESWMEVSSEEWIATVTSYRNVYNTEYLRGGVEALISKAYSLDNDRVAYPVGVVIYDHAEKRYYIPANLPEIK